LRFDPRTEEFEIVTGGLQFGHTTDEWGTRFVCSNSNHIQQVVLPQEYLARNPYLAASGAIRGVAVDGSAARVFRISPPEPWRIIRQRWRAAAKGYKLVIKENGEWEFLPLDPSKKKGAVPTEYPVGFFTSATGITIYTGDAYPAAYRGNAFVGDVGGNLIHRKTVQTDNVVYRARRADEGVEFVRSRDNWFRPVNFLNGPDGALYVLDMYRETVEHPYSVPEEIKKFLHLSSGDDRGRIYRLVAPNTKRIQRPALGGLQSDELVGFLASPNGWTRRTAQRLLWERQDKSVAPQIGKLLTTTKEPRGRLHALYTLAGLNALQVEHLQVGLRDPHDRVRAHAVRLSEPFLKNSPELVASLRTLVGDDSEHVRFQLAFSLGESDHPLALEGLSKLALDPRNGGEVRTALLSSVGKTADKLAAALIVDRQSIAKPHVAGLLAQLGLIIGANPNPRYAAELLSAAADNDVPLPTQQVVLTSLGQGLSRRGGSLQRLLAGDEIPPPLRKQVAELFVRAAAIGADADLPIARRRAALQLLAFADYDTATTKLSDFLSPRTPNSLQQAAVIALAQQESDQVTALILSGWRGFSPQVRRDTVDALLGKVARIATLLAAVEAGRIKTSDIERDKKQLLLKHPNATVRNRSRQLFGSEVNTNRSKVVAQFQDVLNLEPSPEQGLVV
ncbi:MAG: HEAT repeat domain-containing protein, partial [Pirellulaceae bacterium]|nr:HEAT repeat domain-containing protein [Pirellulaceae bacterium]